VETDKNNWDHQSDELLNEEQENKVVIEEASDEVAMCLSELSIWKDQCKRISAEFENFKRRTERDQIRWAEIAKESLLTDLLLFVDTFDMALQQKGNVDVSGIEMAYQSLIKLLQKHDVTIMKNSDDFDPEFHEAVIQVKSDKHNPGQIVDVLTKGFMIKNRVLRPAKVSVSE